MIFQSVFTLHYSRVYQPERRMRHLVDSLTAKIESESDACKLDFYVRSIGIFAQRHKQSYDLR